MEKYNDFALPSLENIEQMAKAFKDLEKKNRIDESKVQKNVILSKDDAQTFYFNISKLCAIADFLRSNFKRNEQVTEIFEKCKKIKLQTDGIVLDLGVEELKDYVVAENTILQDFCFCLAQALKTSVQNLHILEFKQLTHELLELQETFCKY